MIPKQDRQGVRHARDIEQKYDLNTDFSAIKKIAADAQRIAEKANSTIGDVVTTANEAKDIARQAMSGSVYDPQGKAQDIFAYIDAAIIGAIEGSY